MSIEKHKAFLDSLDGEKGLPEEMHRILVPGKDTWQPQDEFWSHTHGAWYFIAPERVGLIVGSGYYGNTDNIDKDVIARRAESRQIPDLKERVKELVLDAMDIAFQHGENNCSEFSEFTKTQPVYEAFRALCSPEVKP